MQYGHFITTILIRIPPFHIKEIGPFKTKERKIMVRDLEKLSLNPLRNWVPESIWDPLEEETEEKYHQRIAEKEEEIEHLPWRQRREKRN